MEFTEDQLEALSAITSIIYLELVEAQNREFAEGVVSATTAMLRLSKLSLEELTSRRERGQAARESRYAAMDRAWEESNQLHRAKIFTPGGSWLMLRVVAQPHERAPADALPVYRSGKDRKLLAWVERPKDLDPKIRTIIIAGPLLPAS